MKFISKGMNFISQHAWMVHIFTVVLVVLIAHAAFVFFLRQLHLKAEKTHTIWDNVIIYAIKRPIPMLIWLFGLTYAAEIGNSHTTHSSDLVQLIEPIRTIGTIILMAWVLFRFIRQFEAMYIVRGMRQENFDKTTVKAVAQVVRVALIISVILIILQTLGIKLSVIWAFGGFGTIAAGFAAKDTLANFFGGLMIYFERPFKIGDWIRSPDKQIEGTVENIGWRTTCIRTFDKRPLYVPNGVFSVIAIENPSRMTNRRIKTNVGIRYEDADKMADIINAVEQMLRQHPDIDSQQTMFVNMVNFGDSALEFMIYTFTKTTDWVKFQAVQQDVFLKVIDIILQHGAQCAFPTRTLYMAQDEQYGKNTPTN